VGYPVGRVPAAAPGPTSREAVNPRVGPTSFSRAAFLNFVPCYFEVVANFPGPEQRKDLIFFSERRPAHSGSLRGIARGLGMTII
jgi:hypothetical protein